MITATEKIDLVNEDARHGGIWRVHNVDGMTAFSPTLDSATITVTRNARTLAATIQLATRHERGHVAVAENVLANGGDGATFSAYDKFQNEVEAWVRGADDCGFDYHGGAFALDCLNTYRRSLGTPTEDWDAARGIIASMADAPDDAARIRAYVPLEPDPSDPPPDCMGDGMGAPSDDGDGDDGDDDDDDDEPSDGGDSSDGSNPPDPQDSEPSDGGDSSDGSNPPDPQDSEPSDGDGESGEDAPDAGTFDVAWLSPEVFAAVEDGDSLAEVAGRFGLDPQRVPPLIRAMRTQ